MKKLLILLIFSFMFSQAIVEEEECFTGSEIQEIELHISTLEQSDSLNVIEINELKSIIQLYKEKDNNTKEENFDVLDIQTKERYLVFKDVIQERERQARKWGDQRHNSNETWNVIGVEEVGEVAKAIYDKDDVSHLYEEIIQVAAVYIAWAESIQREEGTL